MVGEKMQSPFSQALKNAEGSTGVKVEVKNVDPIEMTKEEAMKKYRLGENLYDPNNKDKGDYICFVWRDKTRDSKKLKIFSNGGNVKGQSTKIKSFEEADELLKRFTHSEAQYKELMAGANNQAQENVEVDESAAEKQEELDSLVAAGKEYYTEMVAMILDGYSERMKRHAMAASLELFLRNSIKENSIFFKDQFEKMAEEITDKILTENI